MDEAGVRAAAAESAALQQHYFAANAGFILAVGHRIAANPARRRQGPHLRQRRIRRRRPALRRRARRALPQGPSGLARHRPHHRHLDPDRPSPTTSATTPSSAGRWRPWDGGATWPSGISTSGRSPSVVTALAKAREMGLVTIGMTGQRRGRARRAGRLPDRRAPPGDAAHPGSPRPRHPRPLRDRRGGDRRLMARRSPAKPRRAGARRRSAAGSRRRAHVSAAQPPQQGRHRRLRAAPRPGRGPVAFPGRPPAHPGRAELPRPRGRRPARAQAQAADRLGAGRARHQGRPLAGDRRLDGARAGHRASPSTARASCTTSSSRWRARPRRTSPPAWARAPSGWRARRARRSTARS